MEAELLKVTAECQNQDTKWGIQDHSTVEWIAILTEEVGEAAKEAVDFHMAGRVGSLERLKEELIQVAAVALQAVKSLERQEANGRI